MRKSVIVNDPVLHFVTIPGGIISDLVEHPFFQRLRRIRQLGLTSMVYPGALHTRFHHALGAMHLMGEAIDILRSKGVEITEAEAEAVRIAILLHDIGHGPFSHALENSLVKGIGHEELSSLFMDRLNTQFGGRLSLAIDIFNNRYRKKFLHQLVSSQLDMDRLDYLTRDSFYTGVSEGIIGSGRIIKMLNVFNDELVVDAKGIYSIENFLVSRRLMYWQVYLHKAVIAAEELLVMILKRAKELARLKKELFSTPSLHLFLYNDYQKQDFLNNSDLLDRFAELDDYDIFTAVKCWKTHPDRVLSLLCDKIVVRNLFGVEMQSEPFPEEKIGVLREKTRKLLGLAEAEAAYFVFTGSIVNNAYNPESERINILYKDGTVKDIAWASDQLNIQALSGGVKKYYLCYPKECR